MVVFSYGVKYVLFFIILSLSFLLLGCGAGPDVRLVPIDPPSLEDVAAQPLAGQAYVPGTTCYNDQQLALFFAADPELFSEFPSSLTIGDELSLTFHGQWIYHQAKWIKNCREVVDIPLVPVNHGQSFTKEGESEPHWILDQDFSDHSATPAVMQRFSLDDTFQPGTHYLFVYTCKEVEENDQKQLDCHDDRWVVQKFIINGE